MGGGGVLSKWCLINLTETFDRECYCDGGFLSKCCWLLLLANDAQVIALNLRSKLRRGALFEPAAASAGSGPFVCQKYDRIRASK